MRTREKFETFDREHPDVWVLFEKHLLDWIAKQRHRRTSADAVYHRIRWEGGTSAQAWHRGYALPNEFTPFYARKFVKKYPQYAEFIELRKSKADEDGDEGERFPMQKELVL